MPNWIENKIVMTGEKSNLEKIKDFVKGEEKFDFEKILPIPENIYKGDVGEEELKKYGTNNSLDWCVLHWGTKWNSCNSEVVELADDCLEATFQTAWSFPRPVLKALSKRFPDVEFSCSFYDEDFGRNCGKYIFKSGEAKYMEYYNFRCDDSLTFIHKEFGYEMMSVYGYEFINGKWEFVL